jgi:hypothetical protein
MAREAPLAKPEDREVCRATADDPVRFAAFVVQYLLDPEEDGELLCPNSDQSERLGLTEEHRAAFRKESTIMRIMGACSFVANNLPPSYYRVFRDEVCGAVVAKLYDMPTNDRVAEVTSAVERYLEALQDSDSPMSFWKVFASRVLWGIPKESNLYFAGFFNIPLEISTPALKATEDAWCRLKFGYPAKVMEAFWRATGVQPTEKATNPELEPPPKMQRDASTPGGMGGALNWRELLEVTDNLRIPNPQGANPAYLGNVLIFELVANRFSLDDRQFVELVAPLPEDLRGPAEHWIRMFLAWIYKRFVAATYGPEVAESMIQEVLNCLARGERSVASTKPLREHLLFWTRKFDEVLPFHVEQVAPFSSADRPPFAITAAMLFLALDGSSPYHGNPNAPGAKEAADLVEATLLAAADTCFHQIVGMVHMGAMPKDNDRASIATEQAASAESAAQPRARITTMRLSGWQRIWIVVAVVLLVPALLLALILQPSRDSDLVRDLASPDCRVWREMPGGYAPDAFPAPGQPCRSIQNFVIFNPGARVRSVADYERYLERQKVGAIATAFAVWAIFVGTLYAAGWSVGWIRRGFRRA